MRQSLVAEDMHIVACIVAAFRYRMNKAIVLLR